MITQVLNGGRAYGAIRDVHDQRDSLLRMGASILRYDLPLPPHASLEQWLGPVKDQANLGACTGFAYSGLREFLNRRYENGASVFSPLFIYYKERELEGSIEGDNGASSRSGCWVLAHHGVCLEEEDHYAPSRFKEPPTVEQLTEAAKYKVGAYHRISYLEDVKSCLRSGYCCTMGIPVYESFEGPDAARTGIIPMPKRSEKLRGGHEVLCYGYDDTLAGGALLFRNSWGTGWGRNGNFVLTYAFYDEFANVIDAWMAHLGSRW